MTWGRNYIWMITGATVLALIGMLTAKPVLAQIRAALVANVDEPGRTPYQGVVVVTTDTCCYSLAPVPSGRRLVITNVTGSVNLDAPGFLTSVSLANQQTGAQVSIATTVTGAFAGQSSFSVSAPIQFVADGSQTLQMSISALSAATPSVGIFALSGYLLDCGVASCVPVVTEIVR